MKRALFYYFLAIFVMGCSSKPPVASFTISNNNCQAPCDVSFQNTSTGKKINQYQWDIDGSSSEFSENLTHTFTIGGTYKVKLLVTNTHGRGGVAEQTVTIGNAKPTKCKIKAISISQFPIYAGGSGGNWNWDSPSSGDGIYADCYFHVTDDLGVEYSRSGIKSDIIASDLPFIWQDGATLWINNSPITNFTQNYRLRFWDSEVAGSPTVMKDFNFIPGDYMPNEIGETQVTFSGMGFGTSGGTLAGTIVLNWFN